MDPCEQGPRARLWAKTYHGDRTGQPGGRNQARKVFGAWLQPWVYEATVLVVDGPEYRAYGLRLRLRQAVRRVVVRADERCHVEIAEIGILEDAVRCTVEREAERLRAELTELQEEAEERMARKQARRERRAAQMTARGSEVGSEE